MAILFFAAGIWWVQWWAELPSPAALYGGAAALLAAAFALALSASRLPPGFRRALACALALGIGVAWAALRAEWRLADDLPMVLEGRDLAVTGVVAELPQRSAEGVRFVFAVEQARIAAEEKGEAEEGGNAGNISPATAAAEGPGEAAVPRRIQLAWYRGRDETAPLPEVRPGERWRFSVRLRRPHGAVNPQGFDYEAWLLERNIRATGYVRGGDAQRLETHAGGAMARVHGLRGRIRDRFLAALPDAPWAGMLAALAVGDQSAISAGQWEVFRRSGITHLVAISGMHLSFIAALAGLFAGWIWRRLPVLALRFPARKAAAIGALLAGGAYALLAGMGIPVLRAVIMLAIVASALLLGREPAPGRVLLLALLGVLLADPWAVLAPGFWLSFGAVAVILLMLGGRFGPPRPAWREAVSLQLGITLAMAPALLVLFQSFSVVAPLANALAIPLVNILITPLVLLAAVLPLDALLWLAHWLAALMMHGVEWLAALDGALWRQAAPPPLLAALGVGAAGVLLLPRGAPGKLAAVAVLACLLAWRPARPAGGEFTLTVLDVGNGLAVHVQTAAHDLLYDAGPAYSATADAGERAVLPYLAGAGVERLDMLVLSHDDEDHTGGAHSVLAGVPVGRLLASGGDPAVTGSAVSPEFCAAGKTWTWDGVAFEVLHPASPATGARRGNDDSCVLRIAAPGGAALLTGDIGARAEAALASRLGDALASEIVVAAHHGSRSSSTPLFVDAAMPQAVLFSVGYRNVHGHPHPAVWARWSEAGARNWRTDSQGALRATVTAAGVEIEAERQRAPRYWHGR